jgi:voltage-gated potassium channel Kch
VNDLASRLRAHPEHDLTLAVAGVALGIASILAFDRMEDSWAAFPLLLLLAIPCAILFVLALAPGNFRDAVGTRSDGRLAPWQTVFFLVAVPLLAASIAQLLRTLGEDDPGSGTATWVLVLAGACALWISFRFDSPGSLVLATLLFAAAGLTAVNWIDSEAGVEVYRNVLLVEGVVFLLAARSQWDAHREHAKLLAAISGLVLILGALLGNDFELGGFLEFSPSFETKDGWQLVLIVVTIGLLAFAAWQRHGGSAFVGLLGLLAFLSFNATGGSLDGWPLILALLALACLAWALVIRPSRQDASPPT